MMQVDLGRSDAQPEASVFMMVKNTFIEMQDSKSKASQYTRRRRMSEPMCFSPGLVGSGDSDSEASTDVPEHGNHRPRGLARRATVACLGRGRVGSTPRKTSALLMDQSESDEDEDAASDTSGEESMGATQALSSDGWRTPSTVRSRSPSPEVQSSCPSSTRSCASPSRRVSFSPKLEFLPQFEVMGSAVQVIESPVAEHMHKLESDASCRVGRERAATTGASCCPGASTKPSLQYAQYARYAQYFQYAPPGIWQAPAPQAQSRNTPQTAAASIGAEYVPPAQARAPQNLATEKIASHAAAAGRVCRPPTLQTPATKLSVLQGRNFSEVVQSVQTALQTAGNLVVCVESVHTSKGWTITAYVQPNALKVYRAQLSALAQRALVCATEQSEDVVMIGYAANPFSPMPLGFGVALVEMADKLNACRSSYAHGFCDSPSTCCKHHPQRRVGIHVVFKPARRR